MGDQFHMPRRHREITFPKVPIEVAKKHGFGDAMKRKWPLGKTQHSNPDSRIVRFRKPIRAPRGHGVDMWKPIKDRQPPKKLTPEQKAQVAAYIAKVKGTLKQKK